jgi:signal transduction histidine kinase
MLRPEGWSLARRLRIRLLLATLAVALMTLLAVGAHYGSDHSDLRQRKVLEMAETIRSIATQIDDPARVTEAVAAAQPEYANHPTAYGWRIEREAGPVLAQSGFPWAEVDPLLPRDRPAEWTERTADGAWLAGATFDRDGERWHVVTAARGDPAGLFWRLVLNELVMHVVLPILPLVLLVFWITSSAIGKTLRPLEDLSQQARSIRALHDLHPLSVEAAPAEIRELVAALNAALLALAQARDSERNFLLDASHALRTPLAALKARLELSEQTLQRSAIEADIESLIRLSSQLLAMANSERLVVDPHRRIDLQSVAIEVACKLEPLAYASGVRLEVMRLPGSVLVRGDADALAHALSNLVDNAIRHSPPGGCIAIQFGGDPAGLEVLDEGPGMKNSPDTFHSTRFARAPFINGAGAGLGLSIVSRIMAAHGGKMTIRNRESGGLSVRLSLPYPVPVTPGAG